MSTKEPDWKALCVVLVKADEVGKWAFHCHILNHAESNNGLIGMVTAMVVVDPNAKS